MLLEASTLIKSLKYDAGNIIEVVDIYDQDPIAHHKTYMDPLLKKNAMISNRSDFCLLALKNPKMVPKYFIPHSKASIHNKSTLCPFVSRQFFCWVWLNLIPNLLFLRMGTYAFQLCNAQNFVHFAKRKKYIKMVYSLVALMVKRTSLQISIMYRTKFWRILPNTTNR